MDNGFAWLTEKEAMWAELLGQVLKDNDIPYAAIPVYGAGLAMKAGMQERLKIYVPGNCLEAARKLLDELFPQDGVLS